MKTSTSGPSVYTPKLATVKKIERLTELEKLFEIELDDTKPLNHIPGQFVEVSVFGVGEAPISVTSSPTKKGNFFEICVRAVGNVTNAMHRLKVGSKVGMRGPFGNGFDVEFLRGMDILLIAGGLGIAPLRSLINYVLDNRKDYGKLYILYGCKNPMELLFCDDLDRCKSIEDTIYKLTVDACPEGMCWDGNIGLITTLIPDLEFDADRTYAVVCGPPIMYKFVIQELMNKNITEDHIIVSLERRMKCGIGKCGHCQINGVYVCLDGPVFNYFELIELREALY